MMKVVVVDDEARQCRGLKNILLNCYKDMKIDIFTVAEQALECIEREDVRIIITDICMPGMDGLELTERIRAVNRRAKVILLTGYAEFEYARKAITLGAFDYLLKPLNPEKLQEVLERALEEIQKEDILDSQQKKLKEQLDLTLPVYVERLLNQWVYGWASDQEKAEIEKIIPPGERGLILVTRFPGIGKMWRPLGKEETAERRKMLIWELKEKIVRPWHTLSFFSNILPDALVTVVICERLRECSEKQEAMFLERLMTGINEFHQNLSWRAEDQNIRTITAVGNLYDDLLHNIEDCLQSAESVLPYAFYFPEKSVLRAGTILSGQGNPVTITLAEEELVREAVKSGNKELAEKNIGYILERCLSGGYPDPVRLQNSVWNLLRHIAQSLRLTEIQPMKSEEVETIDHFLDQVRKKLFSMAAEAGAGKEEKNLEFAEKFSSYLNEHYREDLSLDEIAEYFSLTPAYCSTMIREATGTTFSKRLIEIRMRKAKELLLETNLRIYEIAMETGYNDVKYFNRVFKKETGTTPIQYREELAKTVGGKRCIR